jgi:hypothetical protein
MMAFGKRGDLLRLTEAEIVTGCCWRFAYATVALDGGGWRVVVP